jgi:hypothetical protein
MSSPRPSAEFQDHSTMVSQGGSPKIQSSSSTADPSAFPVDSRVDSLDLEAATINVEEEEKKKSKSSGQHHATSPLERRTSAVNEAWPNPELQSNPELLKEAIKEEKDIFLVTFDDNDPLDPKVRFGSLPFYPVTDITTHLDLVYCLSMVPVSAFDCLLFTL